MISRMYPTISVKCPSCGNGCIMPAKSCEHCFADLTNTPEYHKAETMTNMSEVQRRELADRVKGIILTTAPSLEGCPVTETLGIVTAECVAGVNIIIDWLAGIRDVVGGRSNSLQQVLRDARNSCLAELKLEADSLGANAVIGVNLDYSEISGGGKSMLFLVASGTAVKVRQKSENL